MSTMLSKLFKPGLARHAVFINPCADVSVAASCGEPEPRRQRLELAEPELRTALPALPTIGADNALALNLLLLRICTRIGQLAKAEWAYVDFDRAERFVLDANSKTGKGFTVPLAPAALSCFMALQLLTCGAPFVLPKPQTRRTRNHDGAEVLFEQRTLNAMLHRLCATLGDKMRRFTPYNLRFTARSHLAALGVNVIVAERCLDHSLGGLVGAYDQHDGMTERRAALETWASFVLACEAGEPWHQNNVNSIRAGA